MRNKKKRILSIIAIFAMIISTIGVNTTISDADTATVPSWLTTRSTDEDIILSVTDSSTLSLSGISSALGNIAETSEGQSTSIKTTDINVADLSNWYVYDHYDAQVYADEAAYLSGTGYNSALRPYFACNDSDALAWPSQFQSDKTQWTIENAKSLNTNGTKARHLKEHISAGIDQTGAANIYWYGYSDIGGVDWAFYPAEPGGKKTVDYKVDANKIYFHTVQASRGTGFLINTKIVDGKLTGYAVMTNYSGNSSYPSGISGFTILSLNEVNAASLHNGNLSGTTVATKNLEGCTNANGYDLSQIHMDITDTSLNMTITPIGQNASSNAEPVTVFDNQELSDLNAGGFGPIVAYSSHGCNDTSAVDFTDLKMKLSGSESVLNGYANADYTQLDSEGNKSKKYYVLLGNNTNTQESGFVDFFDLAGDRAFLELLKKEEVVLITNLEIDENQTEQGKNGTKYNLAEYLGEDNVVHIDIADNATDEQIAQSIFDAINNHNFNTTQASSATDALAGQVTPTGTNVYVTEVTSGAQADTISAGKSTFTGADLLVNTELSTNNAAGITVTVIDPNGEELEAPTQNNADKATYDPSTKIIHIPPTALVGVYTVNVNDTLTANVTQSIASQTTFTITKNIDVIFNGGTDKNGTSTDGCSTTNNVGIGALDTAVDEYKFVVKLDDSSSPLNVKNVTWGETGVENVLEEGQDYTVAKVGDTYTFTIPSAVLNVIQDKICFTALCSNVFNEMSNVEIESQQGLGNGTTVTNCTTGEDFTAYLNVDSKYYYNLKDDQLTILSDNTVLKKNTDYSYNPETGKVRIFGDVVGNTLTFRGTPTAIERTVTFKEELNLSYEGEATADFDHAYVGKITAAEHYYVKDIEVTSDGAGHETLVSPDDYTFDGTTITINKNHVWGNIIIKATADTKNYNVTNTLTGLVAMNGLNVVPANQTVKYSTVYREQLVPMQDYFLPGAISIKRGEDTLIAGVDYSYDSETGEVMIVAAAVTSDLEIIANGEPNLTVQKHLTGVTFDGPNKVRYNTKYEGTFTLAQNYYHLPKTIKVEVTNNTETTELVDGTDYTYNSETGKLTINASAVTGNLDIYAVADNYNIIDKVENGTVTESDKTTPATIYQESQTTYLYLIADQYYKMPTSEQLKIYYGDTLLSPDAEAYSYDPETGKIRVWASTLTDKDTMLTIVATPDPMDFDVTKNGDNVTVSGGAVAVYGTDYTASLTAAEYYGLPDDVQITVGNNTLVKDQDYTYSTETGQIVIDGTKITDDIIITAQGINDEFTVTKTGTNASIVGNDKATYNINYIAAVNVGPTFNLPSEIVIKRGDELLTEGTDYTYNSSTGGIIINGIGITNDISISAVGVPKEYTVTKTGDNVTVSGGAVAVYGTDYTASLETENVYDLPENVVVKVGDTTLTEGTDYTYNPETGIITIDGSKIIGNITISASATPKKYTATLVGNNVNITGGAIAEYDTDYTALMTADTNYNLPDSIEVKVGDNTLSGETSYQYSKENGEVTVSGSAIKDNIIITANGLPKEYTVTKTGENLTINGNEKAVYGTDYTASLEIENVYEAPENVVVKVGDTTLTEGTDYTYNPETGQITINGSKITGNITISASATPKKYTATLVGNNVTTSGGAIAEYNTDYKASFTVSNTYKLPDSIDVKVGNNTLSGETSYQYSKENGEVTVSGSAITGNLKITITAVPKKYNVNKNGTNITINGDSKAEYGTNYIATLSSEDTYTYPESVEVKVGDDILEEGEDYTYNKNTGKITIKGNLIKDEISIKASGTPKEYAVTKNATNASITGENKAVYSSDYNASVTVPEKYNLPESVSVKVGDTTLTEGTDYTYNKNNGKIVVQGSAIKGDMTITAAGVPDKYEVDKQGTNTTIEGDDEVEYGKDYEAVVNTDDGYVHPKNIEVKVDGKPLEEGKDYTYDKETGAIKINGDKVTGDIEIKAVGDSEVETVLKPSFEEYKKEVGGKITKLESDKNTEEINKLIKEAQKKLSELKYDDSKSFEQNKAIADKILKDLIDAINAAKAKQENTSTDTTKKTETISKSKKTQNEFALNAGLKVSQKGSKIIMAWGKVLDADEYYVYAAYCGTNFKGITKKVKNKANVATITKIKGKKLNLKKNYKIYVVAIKNSNGAKVTLGKTIIAHIVGRKNKNYTNVKGIKLKKSKYTLKVGKKANIKAKTVLVDKTKKQLSDKHAKEFRYVSTNKAVAKVTKNGVIKAVGTGKASVYVYARNGFARKIKVTVK